MRLTIDSATCLLAKEQDPSTLLAPSPGKLTRYLVESGDHVAADQPYVELEVGPGSRSTLQQDLLSWTARMTSCGFYLL